MNTEGMGKRTATFYEELDRVEQQIKAGDVRSKPHTKEEREEMDTWFRGRSKKQLVQRKKQQLDQ